MGLDFLNKKTWHTGSIQNIEKVWLAEQEERKKLKAIQEKTKRLVEERHNEELKRLQAEAGFIPKSHLDRMEWMYDWGHKLTDQQKSNEEYLLGKPVDDSLMNKPFMPVVSKEEITNQKCEDFSKLSEDPLFQIRQQEEKRKQEIRDNPFEIQRLLQIIEQKKKERKSKKQLKKDKKKDKKSKKSKKSKKNKKHSEKSRSRSRSNSSSSSRSSSPTQSQTTKLSSQSTKSATSLYYEQYLKQRIGSIITHDDEGNMIADFGLQKRLNRQKSNKNYDSRPMTEDEKEKIRDEMKQNAIKMKEDKMAKHQLDYEEEDPKVKKGQFLKQTREQIYFKGSDSLADSLGRNKNRLERIREEH